MGFISIEALLKYNIEVIHKRGRNYSSWDDSRTVGTVVHYYVSIVWFRYSLGWAMPELFFGFPTIRNWEWASAASPLRWSSFLSFLCLSLSVLFFLNFMSSTRDKKLSVLMRPLVQRKSSSGKRRKRNVFSLKLQRTPLSPFTQSFWWFVSTELGLMVCLFWSWVSKVLPDQTFTGKCLSKDPLGISVSHSFSTFFNYAIHA